MLTFYIFNNYFSNITIYYQTFAVCEANNLMIELKLKCINNLKYKLYRKKVDSNEM